MQSNSVYEFSLSSPMMVMAVAMNGELSVVFCT